MDRGAWRAIVHGVTKSRTRLNWLHRHALTPGQVCSMWTITYWTKGHKNERMKQTTCLEQAWNRAQDLKLEDPRSGFILPVPRYSTRGQRLTLLKPVKTCNEKFITCLYSSEDIYVGATYYSGWKIQDNYRCEVPCNDSWIKEQNSSTFVGNRYGRSCPWRGHEENTGQARPSGTPSMTRSRGKNLTGKAV